MKASDQNLPEYGLRLAIQHLSTAIAIEIGSYSGAFEPYAGLDLEWDYIHPRLRMDVETDQPQVSSMHM
jgi:hypothetical protein